MKFAAGIDGGGTKTTVELRNLDGQVLDRIQLGPFNLNSIGPESFAGLLGTITGCLREHGTCVSLCIGAAGSSNALMGQLVEKAMQEAGLDKWMLVGDQEIALWGALEGRPGCALIAGTGSICFGRNRAGETARAGGWGHLIDDGGSGYALGADGLRALVRAWDGRAEDTLLTRLVFERLNLHTPQALISYVYGGDKSRVAALAPLVEQAAGAGDRAAAEILRKNARELAELALAVTGRLGLEQGEVALLGGLLTHDTILRRETVEALKRLCPGLTPVPPSRDAASGAAMMALRQARDN
ncbi:MAG: BadF/BadG/BcrA/BcrD ATPase family protein [Eubacteriales bacterium]|nr:BadF/BadG/BcrA/BcrD ATPase family protein [Eubacteriales bacterium]